jgi:hypothetical protein
MFPDAQVMGMIANVIEPAFAEPIDQQLGLRLAGKIDFGGRCKDPVEQCEMVGDGLGLQLVTGRCKVDWPASLACLAHQRDHRRVVREQRRSRLIALGNRRLQGGLASV